MRAVKAAKDGNVQEGAQSPMGDLFEALLPLLTYVCGQGNTSKPDATAAFVSVRLLEHCGAPEEIVSAAQKWLSKAGREASKNAIDIQRPTDDCPPKKRPLPGIPGMSPQDVEKRPSFLDGTLAENEKRASFLDTPLGEAAMGKTPSKVKIQGDQEHTNTLWSRDEAEAHPTEAHCPEEAIDFFNGGNEKSKEKKRLTAYAKISEHEEGSSDISNRKLEFRRRRFTATSLGKADVQLPDEEELMELFRKVPTLKKLSDSDLLKACKIAKCQKYDTDQPVLNLGARNDELHIVIEGIAGVFLPRQVRSLTEGQYFGNEHLLPSIASVEEHYSALHGPVTTISISASDFDSLRITKNHIEKSGEGRVARNFANVANGSSGGVDVDGKCTSTGFPVQQDYVQTDGDAAMIQAAVRNNNVMGDVIQLSVIQCAKIATHVHLVIIPRDAEVIAKGSRGSSLYIVQEGLLDVTVEEGREGEFKLRPGEAFGELGLLYDAARSATVTAATDCKLWILTRSSFQTVIRAEYSGHITRNAEVLKKVPYLTTQVAESNIDLIADMVEEVLLLETEDVCVAGEDTGVLFVVYEGRCELRDENNKTVQTLNKGDWIGEKQLEFNVPADFTVRVISETAMILSLDIPSMRMASATAMSLSTTVRYDSEGGEFDKTRQAHAIIDKQLKKALRSYESTKDKDYVPDLKEQELIGGLGEGSFGLVYLTEHPATNMRYAVKVVSKAHVLREQMGNMLKNERDVMMLLDSDFVVRLYRAYHDHDYIYFLMEPVYGGELFDVYNEQDLFCNLTASRFYVACVIMGLEHLHEKRVIYRDLKLENCLLDSQGYVKLTDMGIAKVVVGKTYTVCGTADYLAPETLRQLGHNRGADWWACSVLLFIMCSGRSPFDAPDVQQIYKNITKGFSKVKFPETFPSDLIDVIKSLGRKKPEERLTMQKGGVGNLREMPYFLKMDWEALADRTLEVPLIPPEFDIEKVRRKTLSCPCPAHNSVHIEEWDGSLSVGAPAE